MLSKKNLQRIDEHMYILSLERNLCASQNVLQIQNQDKGMCENSALKAIVECGKFKVLTPPNKIIFYVHFAHKINII